MINELYRLSIAMQQHGIHGDIYAQNYNEVSYEKCICVSISHGKVCRISSISKEQKSVIRNYTETSNGGFPCVKLAPLFRVTDKSFIESVREHPENIDDTIISRLQSFCIETNWNDSILKKYQRALALAKKIKEQLLSDPCIPFEILVQELDYFQDPCILYENLKEIAFKMIRSRKDVESALNLLFYCVKKESSDSGEISILFNADDLYTLGMPVTSLKFTEELNSKLLIAEQNNAVQDMVGATDAFRQPYTQTDDAMPESKIGAGFYAKIHTMNKDVPCLHRYGQKGCLTFPASIETRKILQQALNYISKKELEGKTWICIDKLKGKPRDILFAYPLELSHIPNKFAAYFGKIDNDIPFDESAKKLLSEIKDPRNSENDSYAKNINIFIIRRLNMDNNSGRTKVIYTRQINAYELEKCSEAWTAGCKNLPKFPFGAPRVLYPLEAADVLNTFWKQNGEKASDSFKPTPKYHGLELLLEPDLPVTADLHVLSEKAMTLGTFLGKLYVTEEYQDKSSETKKFCSPKWNDTKDILALIGLLLYRKDIRKDDYMENLPYIYGQLFKACDELHALYCKVVRNGDIPPQLAAGSLFQSAAEMPVRTLNVLQQRMMPYYLWAKTYRLKDIQESGKESWRAAWLYHLCERIMTKLENNWNTQTRFNDEEKAQLFIGYLAAFSKKEQSEMNSKEETTNG